MQIIYVSSADTQQIHLGLIPFDNFLLPMAHQVIMSHFNIHIRLRPARQIYTSIVMAPNKDIVHYHAKVWNRLPQKLDSVQSDG